MGLKATVREEWAAANRKVKVLHRPYCSRVSVRVNDQEVGTANIYRTFGMLLFIQCVCPHLFMSQHSV